MSLAKLPDFALYLTTLKAEQQRTILAGNFTRIEEYRAACTVVRNLDRVIDAANKILAGQSAAEALAEDGLTEMPEEEHQQ